MKMTPEQKAAQNAPSRAAIRIPASRYDAFLDKYGRRPHPGKAARKAEKRSRRVKEATA